jgi:micrococcal nuclease
MRTLTVSRVIDGDTILLSNDQKVRLIGVDTPEVHESQKLEKDSIRTKRDKATIQALGNKSAEFTSNLVLNKTVRLEYGQQRKDKYGRTLGYLYLPDGRFVNLEIIRQGYAHAYTRFPFKYQDQFIQAERESRENQRGLWRDGSIP